MYPYGYSRDFELQAFTSGYYELLKALRLLLQEDNNYWVLRAFKANWVALLSLSLRYKNDGCTMNCCRPLRPTLPYAYHIPIAVMGNGKD